MSERQIKGRTECLSEWYGEEIKLVDLKPQIDDLINKYGENALLYIGGSDYDIEILFNTPETDEEYAKRLADEETQRNWKALIASASEKLTPEEKAAVNRYRFSNPF